MYKPGADVLIRAKVMADGKLLVAPGALVEAGAADILGDVEHGMGLGERVGLIMYFRSEMDRKRFADGLGVAGGDRASSDRAQSRVDESDAGPHLAS